MKKRVISIVSALLAVCIMASCMSFSAFAASTEHFTSTISGTQSTLAFNWYVPLSAWKTTNGVCCTNDVKTPQPYSLQLRELYVGNEAYNLVKAEDKYADPAGDGEHWMVFKFNITNKSTLPIDVSDIMFTSVGHLTMAGTEIKVSDVSYFNSDSRKCITSVPDIAPGQSADVWNAICIKKSDGYPIIEVPHGCTEAGSQYWTYLYTNPASEGVPRVPTKQEFYADIVDALKSQGGYVKVEDDGTYEKHTFTMNYDNASGNITLTYMFDDKSATDPDGTFQTVISKNFGGNYPFTMTGNYVDVGKVMSIKGTVPSRLDGNYNFHSYAGTDEFHKTDLMEASADFAKATFSTFLTFVHEMVGKDISISMLGFDSKFLCPTGHSNTTFRYNYDATATKDGTKTCVCYDCKERVTISCLGTKTEPTPIKNSALTFKDVQNKWYKSAVDYAFSNGFISGMEADKFGLNTSITRGMFITVLARIAGVDTSKTANNVATRFSDVPKGSYYTNAVKWGYENGIVSGLSSTTFGPNNAITREQLCVMIVNFANAFDVTLDAKTAELDFTDERKMATWSFIQIGKCQKAGIVSGYPNGAGGYEFRPKNTATRAEAAQILYKFHSEFVAKK